MKRTCVGRAGCGCAGAGDVSAGRRPKLRQPVHRQGRRQPVPHRRCPWRAVAARSPQANNLANPNLIFVGQVLCIPAGGHGWPHGHRPHPHPHQHAGSHGHRARPRPPRGPERARRRHRRARADLRHPDLHVIGVSAGQSVTIRTANFPPNQTFTALMGPHRLDGRGRRPGRHGQLGRGRRLRPPPSHSRRRWPPRRRSRCGCRARPATTALAGSITALSRKRESRGGRRVGTRQRIVSSLAII